MELLTLLIPIVVAAVAVPLFDGMKKLIALLDKSPAIVKQIAVTVLVYGITRGAALLGVQLTIGDLGSLTPTDISTIISALLAFLFHSAKGISATKDLMVDIQEANVIERQRRGGFTTAPMLGSVMLTIAGLTVLLACTALAAPRDLSFGPATVGPDSVRFTAVCQVEEPATKCRVVITDSTHHTTLPAMIVAGSDTFDFAVPCLTPLETIVVGGQAFGVNRSNQVSTAFLSARGTTGCGDVKPGAPRSFIIFIAPTG